jgi:hypothetical protein
MVRSTALSREHLRVPKMLDLLIGARPALACQQVQIRSREAGVPGEKYLKMRALDT